MKPNPTAVFGLQTGHSRNFGLDLLRFLAIGFVLLEHCTVYIPFEIARYIYLFLFDGVGIFFVLSGFLIGGILIRHFTKEGFSLSSLTDFWVRRWMRTVPNYFLILSLLLVIKKIAIPGFAPKAYLNFFVFSQNLFQPHPYDFFPEAWSLSIEEWFYLLLPVLMIVGSFLLKGSVRRALILSILLIVAFSVGIRVYRFFSIDTITPTIIDTHFRKQVCTRLDSILIGVVGAFWSCYFPQQWLRHKKTLLACGLSILLVAKVLSENPDLTFFNSVLFFLVNPIGILLLFPYVSQLKTTNKWPTQFITMTSLISYSLYLVNASLVLGYVQPFIMRLLVSETLLQEPPGWLPVLHCTVFFGCTYAISYFLYRFFEAPVMGLRDRILAPSNQKKT